MKNNHLDKFEYAYSKVGLVIENGDYQTAYDQLAILCKEYEHLLGSTHFAMIHVKLLLAQTGIKIGKKKYKDSIEILEQIINDLGDVSSLLNNLTDLYYWIINLLESLYSQINEYRKSISMSKVLIEKLLKEHSQKNGELITQDNMNFDTETRNQLISKYLGLGASYSRLGEYIEARKSLEKGYFISCTYYGDKDERTLKLNYNLAVNEMKGINYQEGLRQLHFVYKDMQSHLDEGNEYTLKAKEVLLELGEDINKEII